MRIYRVDPAGREIMALAKKYRSVPVAIERFERLLSAGGVFGDLYPGLGLTRDQDPASISKYKVIVKELGGKNSGLRYIAEQLSDGNGEYCHVCLVAYVHAHDVKESDVQRWIKERHALYTADSMSALHCSYSD